MPRRTAPEPAPVLECHESFCFVGDDGMERTIYTGHRHRASDEAVRKFPNRFHDPGAATDEYDAPSPAPFIGTIPAPGRGHYNQGQHMAELPGHSVEVPGKVKRPART